MNYINIILTIFCSPQACFNLPTSDNSVNKIFKDNIRLLFQNERLFYDNMNTNNKLANARIILLNYINNVWENENLNTKETIVNGFKKAGIVGNFNLNKDEEKIRDEFIYGLYHNKEIIDDISGKVDISEKELYINELDKIDL